MKVIAGKHHDNRKNDFLVECSCGCSYMRVCRWDILDDDEPGIIVGFFNGYCDKKMAKLKYNPEVLLCPEKAFEIVRFIDIKSLLETEIVVEGNKKNEKLVLQFRRNEYDGFETTFDFDIQLIVRKEGFKGKKKETWLGATCVQEDEFKKFGVAFKKIYYAIMEKVQNALTDSSKE